MPKLKELRLSNNQLSGTIPNFNFPNLTQLRLNSNLLNGTIPNFTSLDLPNMIDFWLDHNQLSGIIPNLNLNWSNLSFTPTLTFNHNCGLTPFDDIQKTNLTDKNPNWKTLNDICPSDFKGVQVINERYTPIPNAIVYQNGQAIFTHTNGIGQLALPVASGDKLVAMELVEERESPSSAHTLPGGNKNIAYQIYRTSMSIVGDGEVQPYIVPANQFNHTLTISPTQTLILFNLIVSLEWNADQDYLDHLTNAFEFASDYFYDVTDGQMALGQVKIYSNRENWGEADIQILAKNMVRPHTFVRGMFIPNLTEGITLGRLWNGNSSDKGPWDRPEGYRTIIHEVGHYALGLYDEYFTHPMDHNGHSGQKPATCTRFC